MYRKERVCHGTFFFAVQRQGICLKAALQYTGTVTVKVTQALISENMRCIWNYRTNWKSLKVRWIFFFI